MTEQWIEIERYGEEFVPDILWDHLYMRVSGAVVLVDMDFDGFTVVVRSRENH